VTEARNVARELWGDDTLAKWWKEATVKQALASDLKKCLIREVKTFVGEAAATDDLTFLVLADDQVKVQ